MKPSQQNPHEVEGSTSRPKVQIIDATTSSKPAATDDHSSTRTDNNRRDFLRGSSLMLASAIPAGIATAATGQLASNLARASRPLRLGLVGCGKRGLDATLRAMTDSQMPQACQLVALADLYPDKLHQASRSLKGRCPVAFAVDTDHRFVGSSVQKLFTSSSIDLVIVAVPPAAAPGLVQQAVEHGKHVFVEAPIAIDSAGLQQFISASQFAREQSLVLSVGLQRRWDAGVAEIVARLRDGAIGDFVHGRAVCNVSKWRSSPKTKHQSDTEYRIRNWRLFEEWSGGPLVEELTHGIDLFNWLLGEHPWSAAASLNVDPGWASASSPGESRASSSLGDTFANGCLATVPGGEDLCEADKLSQPVEYGYRNGFQLLSQVNVSHEPYSSSEIIYGTLGQCDLGQGKIFNQRGELIWRAQHLGDGRASQLRSVMSAVMTGQSDVEVAAAVDATLTAILGRSALATGKRVRWNQAG